MPMPLLAFPPAPATSDSFPQMDGLRGWCKSRGIAPVVYLPDLGDLDSPPLRAGASGD